MLEKLLGKSLINILVCGWYNKNNVGDNLFIEAFRHLFPKYNFIFTDYIENQHLTNVDFVFFGGGSILHTSPNINPEAFKNVLNKQILYIGVGVEDYIHPKHILLMKRAKLIAIRSKKTFFDVKKINSNTIVIPDLVFALQELIKHSSTKKEKSILYLPNANVISRWDEPSWKQIAWENFKSEMAQFLDHLYENEYSFNLFPMSLDREMHDNWAANEIIAKMKHRDDQYLTSGNLNFAEITKFFSKYSVVISQRFHGIILAQMLNIPNLSVHHHNKLQLDSDCLPYYGFNKHSLINKFDSLSKPMMADNNFEELKMRVTNIVG